ncbi:sodium/glucose cotransporter 4-like [Ptychodera flava]|uniref:sodium/glucose cotransporter 4-like n=1 Tax=Ptychodera flava TaxID=63121 RepID=UPI003969CC87
MSAAVPNTTTADNFVVVTYLILVVGVGVVGILRSNRSTSAGYFLGGRSAHFLPLGLSLISAGVSSSQFIGLASISAAWGLAISVYSIMGVFALIVLGWFFAPVYIASGARTLPEYLSLRYGGQRLTVFVSMFSLVLYVFTRLAVTIYSLVIFVQYNLEWNLYFIVILTVIISTAITTFGGLQSILYTSVLYTPVVYVGGAVVTGYAFAAVGGFQGLREGYANAIPQQSTPLSNDTTNQCTEPSQEAFHIFHGATDHNIPGPGTFLGVTIVMMWYWCADQIMVQRTFAAGSLGHAKASTLVAGLSQLLPLFLFVFPGMISRVLYTDEVACANVVTCFAVCENLKSCFHIAYPLLVSRILPAGVHGLSVISVMAGSMSSLSAVLHSGATTFTSDIWKRLRGHTVTDRELIVVYKLFCITLGFITCWWIPVVQNLQGSKLFLFIQSIYSYFAPPLLVCFLLGIIWHKINEEGAYWGLMSGVALGIVRAAVDVTTGIDACIKPTDGPIVLHRLHHLYFCTISLVLCLLVSIVISVLTKPRVPSHKLARLTWATRHDIPTMEAVKKPKKPGDKKEEEKEMDIKNENVAPQEQEPRKRRCRPKVNSFRLSPCLQPKHLEERTPSIELEQKWSWLLSANAVLLGLIASLILGYFH